MPVPCHRPVFGGIRTPPMVLDPDPAQSDSCGVDFHALFHHIPKRSYPRNNVILSAGEQSSAFYLIISGRVKVIIGDEEGREVILALLGAGDYFGEMALLDDEPRSATVVTMEDCQLAVVSRQEFEQALSLRPDITTRIVLGLSKRLREANRKIESLALMDVYGRVAGTLLQLARPRDGKLVVTERLTHQEIASMVGASREMVSRILRDLTLGGYISVEDKHIVLHEKLPAAW